MYRVYCSYRETIYHIMLTKDWQEHYVIIKEIQEKIRNNIINIIFDRYMGNKQKIITIVAGINAKAFLWLKIRSQRLISKHFYS